MSISLFPMNDSAAIAYLRSPQAIRERCQQLFDLACADQLSYFRVQLDRVDAVADYVLQVINADYPDLNIPFHSRWRHFEVGNVPRVAEFNSKLNGCSPLEQAQIKFDLVITSVLLDAGAGNDWCYQESTTGQSYSRSEGLAVASFHWFCQGGFSRDPHHPFQADAIALQKLTAADLAQGFQVNATNPLVGVAGRTTLLQRLGSVLMQHPHLFGTVAPRPGYLVNYLVERSRHGKLPASEVLAAVLAGFSEIWSGRITLAGANLGDVWTHSALSPTPVLTHPPLSTLIPFHKLSQWLTYSLLEPLQDLGLEITQLDDLTGLPEYRNGGLCLDLELVQLKDPTIRQQKYSPGAEAIVEWRALTVILLDQIAATIRQKLEMDASQLPLAKVLQGGTWTAGRKIAAQLRPDGSPPIQIESDGTVF